MRLLVLLALLAPGALGSLPAAGDPLNGRWDAFAPPTPRDSHVSVYDPVRDRVIVFGGRDGTYRNDLWSIELGTGASWKTLQAVGTLPPGRSLHSAIYDPVGDRIIVFSGYSGTTQLDDLWALNLAGTPTWTALAPAGTPPIGRGYHTAVYDPPRHRMIVFGGHAGLIRFERRSRARSRGGGGVEPPDSRGNRSVPRGKRPARSTIPCATG
jgi:hypothetical protein